MTDNRNPSDPDGYRCPNCGEIVHLITVRGPDESYASPCGCLIPPRAFA